MAADSDITMAKWLKEFPACLAPVFSRFIIATVCHHMIPKFKTPRLRVSAIASTKHAWTTKLAVMSAVSKCCCCCRSVGQCTSRRRAVNHKPRERCMSVVPCEIRQTGRSRSMVAASRVTKRWLLGFGTKVVLLARGNGSPYLCLIAFRSV